MCQQYCAVNPVGWIKQTNKNMHYNIIVTKNSQEWCHVANFLVILHQMF